MRREILYLSPMPPIKNGIADYACCYRNALETCSDWRFQQQKHQIEVSGGSLRDMRVLYRRVKGWKQDGTLRRIAFVHAEIGYKQHEQFYLLYCLRRLCPDLPYCITIHDPPLVIAPVLKPLSLGIEATPVRHALRVLDYTPLGRGAIRAVLSRASNLFTLSDRGQSTLRSALGRDARISRLPFLNYRSTRPNRKAADQPMTILFSGFWGKSKGIEILIQMMENLQKQGETSVRLWMTGGPEQNAASQFYADTILQRIRSSPACRMIDVRGYIAPEQIDATFDSADIFVLPTTHTSGYSTSSVLFRAMAAGLPILATDTGMISEEIFDRKTGRLVPPSDVNALTTALIELLHDEELRTRLGRNAQDHVYTEHSQEHVAQLASAFYDQMG